METSVALFEKDFVEKLLPQKFPFVMVDKMYLFTETCIVVGLTVQEDNIFYNNGVFLESGLIEHMAQSVAMHTGYEFFLKQEQAPTGYIGSIKDIEIKRLPHLNDVIKTTATVIQKFGDITLVDLITTLNNETIATCQMKTILAK
jgi:predicted hotdog family 3-hydroxylacyl-ACP dehydratase